ncbi:hypothetical protein DL98DRAFT_654283 [Cadophora sp. DSE1049]|nr:hypothetical protein DL98DRAFT_654283 [Cadophora sp. DSE1049]
MAPKECIPSHVTDTGFTVLHNPPDPCADIIFIHGLQGHPKNTWTKKLAIKSKQQKVSGNFSTRLGRILKSGSQSGPSQPCPIPESLSSDGSVFWPESCLPEDCPSARIATWGYNSAVTRFFKGPTNQNTFYDHANDLLMDLNRLRKGHRERPLIFAAHSLGGLIVKQALCDSKSATGNEELKLVVESTKAIFFFGTPHRGSSFEAWGRLAQGIAAAVFFDTNGRSIGHLAVNGENLAQLEKSFGKLLYERKFQIHSFHESLGLMGVKGLNARVVEPWSASVGDPGREKTDTIDANHMDMCRFNGPADRGYQKVSAELRELVEGVEGQFSETSQEDYDAFLYSFQIPEVDPQHVSDPYENTGNWIFSNARFRSWIRDEHGVFWIKGKPGSGKSTLMKHLSTSRNLDKLILTPRSLVKTKFFFTSGGSHLDQTLASFLQSILYQILKQRNDCYQRLLPQLHAHLKKCWEAECKRRWKNSLDSMKQPAASQPNEDQNPQGSSQTKAQTKKADFMPKEEKHYTTKEKCVSLVWDAQTLTILLLSAVEEEKITSRMLLFIDALDECREADRDLVQNFLKRLLAASKKSPVILDICISSRPDTAIDIVIDEERTILMQEHNESDILTFVDGELISRSLNLRGRDQYQALARRVIEKSDGIFLWVLLVVPRLRNAIRSGERMSTLTDLLEELPERLEDLFRNIIGRVSDNHLVETIRMIQLVVLAERPLTLEEFRHAISFPPGCPYLSLEDWEKSDEFIEPGAQVAQLIESRTGGLLEVRTSVHSRREEQQDNTQYRPFRYHSLNLRRKAMNAGARLKYKFQSSANESALLSTHMEQKDDSADGDSEDTEDYEEFGPGSTVRMLHDTAKHFFLQGSGFEQLAQLLTKSKHAQSAHSTLKSLDGSYLAMGHAYFAETCLNYFRLDGIVHHFVSALSKVISFSDVNVTLNTCVALEGNRYPLLRYGIPNWLDHARKADEMGIDQASLLHHVIRRAKPEVLVGIAVENNLLSWLVCLKSCFPSLDFDTPSLSYGWPMRTAVKKRYFRIIHFLIDAGANPNGTSGGPETTLKHACRDADDEMRLCLLSRGAKLDQPYLIAPEGMIIRL